MYRLFIRLVIFAVAISLSLYIGAQWKLKQDLELIDKQLGPLIEFSYQSSALALTGKVIVGGVNIKFNQLGINVEINKVKLKTGSIFKMAFLSSQFKDKTFPEDFSLVMDEVVIPLTPELVRLIAATEQPDNWNRLSAAGCGQVNSLGINQYFAMGFDYLVFSSDIKFSRDSYSGNFVGSGHFNIEETAEFNLEFDIADFFESLEITDAKAVQPSIESLTFSLKDKGYNRHRNEYCALKAEMKPEVYLGNHVKEVKKKLESVDIKVTPTGVRFYTEYLQPDSELNFSINPKASFSMTDFGFYNEKEIRDILDLKLLLNGNSVGLIFNDWSHDKFTQIVFRDKNNDDYDGQTSRFETVVVRRSYQSMPLSTIATQIGEQAKLILRDNKVFTGKINKVENGKVFLESLREGGTMSRSVELDQLSQLEILVRDE